jgi:hypothetical protein
MDNWASGFRIDEADALEALEAVPGLQIERSAGHDA